MATDLMLESTLSVMRKTVLSSLPMTVKVKSIIQPIALYCKWERTSTHPTFVFNKHGEIKVIVYDKNFKKQSEVAIQRFDLLMGHFRLVGNNSCKLMVIFILQQVYYIICHYRYGVKTYYVMNHLSI